MTDGNNNINEIDIDEGEKIDLSLSSIPQKEFTNLTEDKIKAMKLIEASVRLQFKALNRAYGLDLSDNNLTDTPQRIAKMLILEKMIGINSESTCAELLSKNFQKTKKSDLDQMIIVANPATAYSICPHHFENVMYEVYMAYVPTDNVVGLSKFSRIISLYARQPLLQEDYTDGLTEIIDDALKPKGVIVVVKGKHNCMITRGANSNPEQWIITSSVKGVFKNESTFKEEFLSLCKLRG